jgi:hypothetical protein
MPIVLSLILPCGGQIASSIKDVMTGVAVGMVVVVAAGQHLLEVFLPSLATSSSLSSSSLSLMSSLLCCCGRIHGGNHHGITPGENEDDKLSSSFAIEVCGVGLFLAYDLLGIPGHKLCLVLPLIAVPDNHG